MRVLIISDFGTVNGGAAKVAIESARGLAEAGVSVVFACAIAPVSERLDHPNIAVAFLGADEVWKVGSRLQAARQGIWNDAAHVWLRNLMAAQPAGTIIHLHQWTKAFSPSAIAAAAESGRPVVVTLHDYFAFCPAGGYFDFQKGRPCDKSPMAAGCLVTHCDRTSYAHKLVRVARQLHSNRALSACRDLTILHVSDFARRFAEPFLPPHARHVTVENMMEAPKQAPAPVASNRHALFLGRFTREKAADVLAAAARQAGVPVRFVGDGPLAQDLRRINPDAEICGWVSPDRVFAEMAQARTLVLPSIWFEPGPLVVAEARSVGVPVVLARTTGPASWIEDGVDGLLVDGGDREQLAQALTLLTDDDRAAAMGAAAYAAYWRDPLTTQRHVGRTLDAYGAALVAHRRAA